MKKARIPKGEYTNSTSKEKQGTGGLRKTTKLMKPAKREPCVETMF